MTGVKLSLLWCILLWLVNGSRDCLYTSSSKTQIINLQHELFESLQCIACLPQCRSCYSSSDTTCASGNCQSRYFYQPAAQVCSICQNMCEQCTDLGTCEKCIGGYYLNGKGQCLQCMGGVLACTSSSILSCMDGYYYDSQTYVCRRCSDANCAQCSAKGSCDQCSNGYLLNSGSTACVSCGVSNCTKCLSVGTCQTCATGYRLQSNTYCIKQNCSPINKCKECTNNTNIITCTLCQAGYYLLDNSCHYGASMMCEYSLTPTHISQVLVASASTGANSIVPNILTDYGSCGSCDGGVAKRAQNGITYCIPKQVGSDGSKVAEYRVYNQFNICTMPYTQVSRPSTTFMYSMSMSAAYAFQLTLVTVVFNVSGTTLLNYANLSSLFGISVNINNSATANTVQAHPLYCTTPAISQSSYIFKHTLQYKVLTDYPPSAPSLNSTVVDLSVAISLNTSLPELANAQLSTKQSYFQLYLCAVANCLQCLSATSCTKCKYPYLIQDFVCVLACDMGYYLNKNMRTCSSQCASGYYPAIPDSTTDYLCVLCQVQCVLCVNASYCTMCALGYFLTVDNLCRSDCANGSQLSMYYPDLATRECRKCMNPCRTCGTNPNNCTSCLIGFQVYNGTMGVCVFNCPLGYFEKVLISSSHQTNPQCLRCSAVCLQCDIQADLCTACGSGQYLFSSTCMIVCPAGYYGSSQNTNYGEGPKCRPCVYPCSKCTNSASNCTQCQYGLLLASNDTGKCTNVCPTQMYYAELTLRRCLPCPVNCRTCISTQSNNHTQIVCSQCVGGFVLESGACVGSCSNAWTIDDVCQSCPYPCINCSGVSSTNYSCTTCAQQFYLSAQNQCVLLCGIGYYSNATSRKCHSCPSSCLECTLPINQTTLQCISCISNYTLANSWCIPISGGCPSSTYLSQSSASSQCLACSPSCQQCILSPAKCTSCKTNAYLLQVHSQCVSSCPYGYIGNASTLKCMACSGMCSNCFTTATNCTQCKQGAYLYTNTTSNTSTCLLQNECSSLPGYYVNQNSQVCSMCVYPCTLCSSLSLCSKCAAPTLLYRTACLPECPVGYYPNNTECRQCPSQCASCTSQSVCLACKPNYLYRQSSGECLSACKMYQYANYGSMSCETCKPPCMECSSMEYCLSCAIILINNTQYTPILFNGQCLDHCYDGYYMLSNDTVHQCRPCNLACQTCTSLTNCTTCSYGSYLYLNQCIKPSECPALSYPDAGTRKCSPCQPPCVLCLSRYECASCVVGHLLKQGSCYINCPIGTYPNGTACAKCPDNCTRCTKYSECQACTPSTYLFTNSTEQSTRCVWVCPDGSFFSSASKMCQICSQSCSTCSQRSNNCTSCPSPRILQQSSCVSNCSKYYYYEQMSYLSESNSKVLKSCQKCNTSCSSCIDFNICTTCVSSYLITSNLSVTFANNTTYYRSYCSYQCPPATFKNSEQFICQKCQDGCLSCTSQINCLSCSLQQGYVLYNIKCVSAPCLSDLYTIIDENKCVDRSYCEANTDVYLIYHKENQCYRKDRGQCPNQLVMTNQNQCVDQCPSGYLSDFNRKCVSDTENVDDYKFKVTPVAKNGFIEMIISFNAHMNQKWVELFNNVTVSPSISWKSQNKNNQISESRRLLAQGLQFQVVEDTSENLNNALKLLVVFTSPIPSPTDLTFYVSMSQPYTDLISINGKPLQNWQAQAMIKSYMLTQQQLNSYKSKDQGMRALPILLIIFAVALTIVNLAKSGKIYLLVPTWDFMQLLYLMNYLPVYWPLQMRLFLDTFSVTWLRWFHPSDNSLVFSPEKVHAIATDMNLIRNILCNVVLISFTFLAYGICVLIKSLMKLGKKQPINKMEEKTITRSKKQQRVDAAINIIKKLIIGVSYLSVSNILYFSLVNVFYQPSQIKNPITFWYVLSVMVIIALPALLLYAFYQQMRDKSIFDAGINPLKQRIIICLPLYLMLRKLFIILFLGIMSYDAAFPICFGFVVTGFIFILISWFQPYNNSVRYKSSLANEAALFLFLTVSFVYICNQRDMMQSGYSSSLIFLAVVVLIITFFYPSYHLFCLLQIKKYISHLLNIKEQKINEQQINKQQEGICIQQIIDNSVKIKNDINEPKQYSIKNNNKQYQPPADSDTFSCAEVFNSITQKEDKITSNADKHETAKQKKKKKMKLPKDQLIPGQTDHQADESSQQGEKNKMKLADYTTRLTKRGPPAVRKFKNYDINQNDSENDDDGLAEKQIQLSKLIERQRTIVRNQTKIKQPQQEIAQQIN